MATDTQVKIHSKAYESNEAAKTASSGNGSIIFNKTARHIYVDGVQYGDDIASIETATESTEGVASAYDVKQYVESKVSPSSDSYKFVLNDDGSLQCVKNDTEEGFVLDDDGSLSLKS